MKAKDREYARMLLNRVINNLQTTTTNLRMYSENKVTLEAMAELTAKTAEIDVKRIEEVIDLIG